MRFEGIPDVARAMSPLSAARSSSVPRERAAIIKIPGGRKEEEKKKKEEKETNGIHPTR